MTSNPQIDRKLRLSLPSKGRMSDQTIAFLKECGFTIHKPNPRQYQASIREIPMLDIFFQRPTDIVTSVRDGSMDFGISGLDIVGEFKGENDQVLVLHDAFGYGECNLQLAVPEEWKSVQSTGDLADYQQSMGRPLRIVTKFPNLTKPFLAGNQIEAELVFAEGTLETAPAIGHADMISDLVSSGQTLRDNRLRAIPDAVILKSQASLIANFNVLKTNPEAQQVARILLESIEAHKRGKENVSLFANMRGTSPEQISKSLFENKTIRGLQGPTISNIYVTEQQKTGWYAVNVVVKRTELLSAIAGLRAIGGSGVVVMPVTYIFEEEPLRIQKMMQAINTAKEASC